MIRAPFGKSPHRYSPGPLKPFIWPGEATAHRKARGRKRRRFIRLGSTLLL